MDPAGLSCLKRRAQKKQCTTGEEMGAPRTRTRLHVDKQRTFFLEIFGLSLSLRHVSQWHYAPVEKFVAGVGLTMVFVFFALVATGISF